MKIVCIGRNYIDHAKELNNDVPAEPVMFFKPDSALLPKRNPFYIPSFSNDVHHEVELVVKINRLGKNISEKFAPKYYSEIGIGIDFTARDVQKKLKEKGLPWEKAKAFDHSAPISHHFININDINDINDINFSLEKNGQVTQVGNSKDMIFNINKLISEISKFTTLKIGDLIFTGTPKGVSKVNIGDVLDCYIEEEKMLTVKVK